MRDVVVLEAFFTPWSSLVRQELELNDGLQQQQIELFSRPESTKDVIPQLLLWVKIKDRRRKGSPPHRQGLPEQPHLSFPFL